MARSAETRPCQTDAEILAHAWRALDQRPSIPTTVRVHIDDGLAWLTGTVRRMSERIDAETIVREVPGVQRVVNRIAVSQPPSDEGFEPPEV